MPQGPAPARGGISPAVIAVIGGLVIVALIIAGIAVVGLSRNNSGSSTPPLLTPFVVPSATPTATPLVVPTAMPTAADRKFWTVSPTIWVK